MMCRPPRAAVCSMAPWSALTSWPARTRRYRVVDYKLTPAQMPSNDLFQVSAYALMHDIQHRTRPEAAVLYLHPARHVVSKTWEEVDAERHKIYNLIASMREWIDYNE